MREPIKDFYGRVLGWLEDQGFLRRSRLRR